MAIASLKVGDQVQAYDPKTGKTKVETVDHVFINHDDNLLNVTIQPSKKDEKPHAQAKDVKPETLHTTSEHPFLTTDRGFVDAIMLHIGEKVQQADGSYGIVVSLRVVSGTAVRYNLTVHELHTYLVGNDQWVVHNVNCTPEAAKAAQMARDIFKATEKWAKLPANKYYVNTSTVAVGILDDGRWVASVYQGGNPAVLKFLPDYVRSLGGEWVGPKVADEFTKAGPLASHAESYILDHGGNLVGIGASINVCKDICIPAILKAGYDLTVIGNPEP